MFFFCTLHHLDINLSTDVLMMMVVSVYHTILFNSSRSQTNTKKSLFLHWYSLVVQQLVTGLGHSKHCCRNYSAHI